MHFFRDMKVFFRMSSNIYYKNNARFMKNKSLKLDFKLNKTIYNYINNEVTFFHKLQSVMFGFKLLSVLSVRANMYGRRYKMKGISRPCVVNDHMISYRISSSRSVK